MAGLSWLLPVRDIPAAGLPVDRQATAEERASLASDLGILGLDALRLRVSIRPRADDCHVLTGTLFARVVQSCIVTLEPVPADLDLPLEIELRPAGQIAALDEIEAEESLLDEPDVEPIVNGVIDLGRIVYEELASGLDAYPRHPDAAMDRTEAGADGDSGNPFAALRRLKPKPDPSESP